MKNKSLFLIVAIIIFSNTASGQLGPVIDYAKVFGVGEDLSNVFRSRLLFFSPDGERILFTSDQDEDGGIELYGGRIRSGFTQKINEPFADFRSSSLVTGTRPGIRRVWVTPDQEHVVFTKTLVPFGSGSSMYIARIDGVGEPIRLTFESGSIVRGVDFSDDGTQMLVSSSMFAAPLRPLLSNTWIHLIDLNLVSSRPNGFVYPRIIDNVLAQPARFSVDSSEILFIEKPTSERDQVSIGYLKSLRLSDGVISTLSNSLIEQFILSSENNNVVFIEEGRQSLKAVDLSTQEVETLATVSTDRKIGPIRFINADELVFEEQSFTAGPRTLPFGVKKLNSETDVLTEFNLLPPNSDTSTYKLALNPFSGDNLSYSENDKFLTYYVNEYTSPVRRKRLAAVFDLESGQIEQLLGEFLPIGFGQDVEQFLMSPDESKVAFVVGTDLVNVNELYTFDLQSSELTKAHSDFVSGESILINTISPVLKFSPDSKTLFYVAKQDSFQGFQLYATNLESGANFRINQSLTNIVSFAVGPKSDFVVWFEGDGRLKGRGLAEAARQLCFPIVSNKSVSNVCL